MSESCSEVFNYLKPEQGITSLTDSNNTFYALLARAFLCRQLIAGDPLPEATGQARPLRWGTLLCDGRSPRWQSVTAQSVIYRYAFPLIQCLRRDLGNKLLVPRCKRCA